MSALWGPPMCAIRVCPSPIRCRVASAVPASSSTVAAGTPQRSRRFTSTMGTPSPSTALQAVASSVAPPKRRPSTRPAISRTWTPADPAATITTYPAGTARSLTPRAMRS